MIKCIKCWLDKDESMYWTTTIKWVKYYRHTCKKCMSAWQKEYRLSNSSRLKEQKRNYYLKNRDYLIGKNYYNYHFKWWNIKRKNRKLKNKIYYKFYDIYYWIIDRCYNPRCKIYKYYWWRWIKCKWNSFSDFYTDMYDSYIEWGTSHWFWKGDCQIDRIDNDGNYCKSNCRWVTSKQNNSWNHQKEIDICKIILLLKKISNEKICPSTS